MYSQLRRKNFHGQSCPFGDFLNLKLQQAVVHLDPPLLARGIKKQSFTRLLSRRQTGADIEEATQWPMHLKSRATRVVHLWH